MLASRTTDGLLGLDRSIDFSSAPLDHVVLVIHGLGDQYTDSPPWLTALETNLRLLQRSINRLHDPRARRATPPAVLLVPLEYHTYAQRELAAVLRPSTPAAAGPPPAVRVGIAETVGDLLLAASPRFRDLICQELKAQALEQLAAVRRARPAFSAGRERVSVYAHSAGAVYGLHMLATGMLDDVPGFDALITAGSPAPAYLALDPEYSERIRSGVVERRRNGTRLVNVFHALDPASYRLEPWIADGGAVKAAARSLSTPVRVGQVDKQTLWDEATAFWDGTVQNVISTLFSGRRGESDGKKQSGSRSESASPSSSSRKGGSGYGAVDANAASTPPPEAVTPELAEEGGSPSPRALLRNKSYMLVANVDDGEDVPVGNEVLLGDRIDFELEGGMDASQIDVVTNWAAVKAHGFYWRSTDVARILVDIAGTSAAVKKKDPGRTEVTDAVADLRLN
jgi:DDHD domain